MWSLDGTLERIRPALPEALVSARAFARALQVARRLPAALASCVYFERWLAGEHDRADLIVRVDREAAALLTVPPPAGLSDAMAAHPAWRTVMALARAWRDGQGALSGQVEGIWLEFDLPADAATTEPPVPRLFVDFVRDPARPSTPADRLPLALEALRVLLGPEAERHAGGVRAALAALPPGADAPYLGLSLLDPASGVRLCIRDLGPGLAAYLRAVGWPGDTEELVRDVLAPLSATLGGPGDGVSYLHIDVRSPSAPRIGLEYAFQRAPQWEGRLVETALLDLLVARGWCGAAEREALVLWPGGSIESFGHELWPTRVGRRLSHVKVTYAEREPVTVKAYLCALLDPMRTGTVVGGRRWLPAAATGLAAPRRRSAIE